ncbi:MAG TPA: hypothetical protein VH682_13205 [Gemmataceae bacterium]|jgi:hypothetical protein
MNAIKGIVQNGHIVLDKPADLPEGCRVLVEPIVEEATFGICEEDWQDTPEAIAAWLQWYDTLEPLQLTPQEEAEWQAARQAQNEREKTAFAERAEKLRRMWE